MLVIALTGGIGSGKTTVSDMFKAKNIPIIDTDIIARKIVEYNKPAYHEVSEAFGEKILDKDKNINREELQKQIFSSPEKRKKLEKILHPAIWNEVKSQLASVTTPYCIIVVPLLFETPEQNKLVKFNRILVVDSPEELQVERTVKRDNSDESLIRKIVESQVTRQIRLDSADDIIVNTGDLDALNIEVEKLHQQYLKISK